MNEPFPSAYSDSYQDIKKLKERIAELERMLERESFISAKPKHAIVRARAEERERCVEALEQYCLDNVAKEELGNMRHVTILACAGVIRALEDES